MRHLTLAAIMLAGLTACSGGNKDGSKPAKSDSGIESRYQRWRQALTDSVDSLDNLYRINQSLLDSTRNALTSANTLYEVIADPVLVEKYRVARGWRGYDSYATPGIFARLLEDGTLEVVVTRAGAPFTSVTLSAGADKLASGNVPRGNALNTTAGGLNRVAFNNAGALADFVAAHQADRITISFSSGGSMILTDRQKQMLTDMAELPRLLRQVNELEQRGTLIYNKSQIFRSKINEGNTPENTEK